MSHDRSANSTQDNELAIEKRGAVVFASNDGCAC